MGLFFDDPLFEEFTSTLALGLASHGGAELGEVQATCARIVDGDDESWLAAWRATADRLVEAGDDSAAGGHRVSARESYLRASFYYALAYHPLFEAPPDARLLEAFGSQRLPSTRPPRYWSRRARGWRSISRGLGCRRTSSGRKGSGVRL